MQQWVLLNSVNTKEAYMQNQYLRQQYHFRKSDDDILIWDAHRLIRLSSDFDVVDVKLDKRSELHQVYWFKNSKAICKAIGVHAKLINEANLDYPITLSGDGRVIDGMHRVTKASMLGLNTIKAVQF